MKQKWYLKTWLICLLFAFWFLYGIPLLIGIILLFCKNRQDKLTAERLISLENDKQSLENDKQLLKTSNTELQNMLTPDVRDANKLKALLVSLHEQEASLKSSINNLQAKEASTIQSHNETMQKLDGQIQERQKQLVILDDEILVQEFGLYQPKFDFASALDYKEELAKIRSIQKELIKNKEAVTGNMNWTVNGSTVKGKKMISDTQKLLLRAFNSECDELVSKVKYTNYESSLERIYKSAEAISKLGATMRISITNKYLDAKIKELRLAFEYQLRKQEEKEQLKIARAEQREQAKAQRELEEQKKKIEKEQNHYQNAYNKLITQLSGTPDNPELLRKKLQLETQLSDIDKALTNIDYRQANARAGYVYVISNIGSFGENVFKIGMTRRLDPQERVDELGDASVPFNFDVHAMIFSDDAPALEAALHRAFEDRKVNMVNHRREFFNVTLEEIKEVIRKNFDKTVEFTDVPDAEQYRVSQRMRSA